ncbi:hypothetical protein LWI28_009780 [Acer negundo]|uniref:Uncharacterized protein n=1 Tax=Acer negundo TaxID=4023 RepID=A0AAD5J5I9_ACENE|nr:hypothetical protein LWI28_009780 [Acer negundo]
MALLPPASDESTTFRLPTSDGFTSLHLPVSDELMALRSPISHRWRSRSIEPPDVVTWSSHIAWSLHEPAALCLRNHIIAEPLHFALAYLDPSFRAQVLEKGLLQLLGGWRSRELERRFRTVFARKIELELSRSSSSFDGDDDISLVLEILRIDLVANKGFGRSPEFIIISKHPVCLI